MIQILVCEDEENIRNLYKIRLEKYDYKVVLASNGEEALALFYKERFDLIIIDVMMPKKNGFEVISELRDMGYKTPAIIVSARGELSDKLCGFENGIDDYLVKPFEFEELRIRIKALLRRSQIQSKNQIQILDLTLNANTITLKDSNHTLALPKREFMILFKLLSYPERTFSKEDLFEEFWSLDNDIDSDVVKVYISRIRNRIKIFPQIEIKTIRGIGYQGVRNER